MLCHNGKCFKQCCKESQKSILSKSEDILLNYYFGTSEMNLIIHVKVDVCLLYNMC